PTLHSFPPKDETFGAILTHRGKHRAQTFSVYLLALYSIVIFIYRFLYCMRWFLERRMRKMRRAKETLALHIAEVM
ncbi:hypothetical protein, partial [Escherichia coli]|uniref:hypothetical protein n=1 Tax=Escherichia coli TaxID=562 RepID=UPI001957456A